VGSSGLHKPSAVDNGPPATVTPEGKHGEGEVRADEAARERGDDRSRGPRQDDLDGCDHAASGEQRSGGLCAVRFDRQGT
jgi:hypothetical protein